MLHNEMNKLQHYQLGMYNYRNGEINYGKTIQGEHLIIRNQCCVATNPEEYYIDSLLEIFIQKVAL